MATRAKPSYRYLLVEGSDPDPGRYAPQHHFLCLLHCTETLTCPALACIGLGLDVDGGEKVQCKTWPAVGGERQRELGLRDRGRDAGDLSWCCVEGSLLCRALLCFAVLCRALLCSALIPSRNQILSSRRLGLAASTAHQLARSLSSSQSTPSLSREVQSPVGCHAGSMA